LSTSPLVASEKLTILANKHVIPSLGARKLRELTAKEGDIWLAEKAKVLSTRTLREVRSIPVRAITRAQAREKVKRNVLLLCELPQGQVGRQSKALNFEQAEALLNAAERTQLRAYIVLSLLLGGRTEALRLQRVKRGSTPRSGRRGNCATASHRCSRTTEY
jgi:hypothetical protein